ncbi:MAG: rhamnogalacturonan acetylesterase [Opitutus sp.]|nr:rhamnogalacturonan acetylesterase [Opitutus sp.]
MKFAPVLVLLPLALAACVAPAPAPEPPLFRFNFGSGSTAPGVTPVDPGMVYSKDRGFGFEAGATLIRGIRSVTSDQPFFFSVKVPAEGNYRVTVTLGDAQVESTTTIKAELRRLMVEKIHTTAGKFATVSFIVNTRNPKIAAVGHIKAGAVKLKAPRETTQEAWGWDDLLTLEFNNSHPALSALEITPVDVPTVFLIGDSTVGDQSREPFSSWGQSFTRFFKPGIAIANHGESGETYRDSLGRRRLDKMLSVMKPGDWMIMQFGHNDQKQIAAGTGGPFTTYQKEIKQHVDAVRAHGGTPVIVSPMERRNFTADGKIKPSLADYAEASRQAAKGLGVTFIDLNAMSILFYEALGKDQAYRAFAGTGPSRDPTHHDNYGSYELAKCIVQGLRTNQLPLAKFIVDDFKGFDPAHPDDVDAFALPPSPNFTNQRPLGD